MELSRRFEVDAAEGADVLARAVKLGVLVPVGRGRYEVPSPSLLEVGDEVVQRGISLHSAMSVLEDIERHSDSVSRSFVQLFLAEIWKPFAQADMPAERWPEVEAAVARLRPIASEALMAIFQRRLSSQIESAFSEITRRLSERSPKNDRADRSRHSARGDARPLGERRRRVGAARRSASASSGCRSPPG